MKVEIISEEVNRRIRRDDDLKLALAKNNNVKVVSIDRWLREDDVMLTTSTNMQIIRKGLNIPESESIIQIVELAQ